MTSNIVGKTCPYCQTPIKPGIASVVCSSCGMPHHQDCWVENGGCTTFGCPGRITSASQPSPTGLPYQQAPHSQRSVAYQRPMPPPLPPGMVYQQQPPSQLGLASMILGIISLVLCLCVYIGWIPALLAIIFGAQAKRNPTADQSMATAGIIMGIIGLAATVILSLAGFNLMSPSGFD